MILPERDTIDLTKDFFYKCPKCPSAYISKTEFIKHLREEGFNVTDEGVIMPGVEEVI